MTPHPAPIHTQRPTSEALEQEAAGDRAPGTGVGDNSTPLGNFPGCGFIEFEQKGSAPIPSTRGLCAVGVSSKRQSTFSKAILHRTPIRGPKGWLCIQLEAPGSPACALPSSSPRPRSSRSSPWLPTSQHREGHYPPAPHSSPGHSAVRQLGTVAGMTLAGLGRGVRPALAPGALARVAPQDLSPDSFVAQLCGLRQCLYLFGSQCPHL